MTGVDPGSPPVPNNSILVRSEVIDLNGATTTYTLNFKRNSISTSTHWANVYYTVNSMIKEVTGWSSNLNAGFTTPNGSTPLRIGMDEVQVPGGARTSGPWGVNVGWEAYRMAE